MDHFQKLSLQPPEEGAALRIGPLEPGQPDDEYHLYIDPGQRERIVKISRQVEDDPFTLTIHLTLEGVQPKRDVLATLRLSEASVTGEEEQVLGYRLMVCPAHEEALPKTMPLPPIRFLLSRPSDPALRHLVLRITAKYSAN